MFIGQIFNHPICENKYCAILSPVHDYVQYTVIIGGLIHTYHMYHMECSAVSRWPSWA